MAEGRSLYVQGVRTDEAREDWAAYWRSYRRRPFKNLIHGLRATYVNHRCRCPECYAAAKEYRAAHRAPVTEPSMEVAS